MSAVGGRVRVVSRTNRYFSLTEHVIYTDRCKPQKHLLIEGLVPLSAIFFCCGTWDPLSEPTMPEVSIIGFVYGFWRELSSNLTYQKVVRCQWYIIFRVC